MTIRVLSFLALFVLVAAPAAATTYTTYIYTGDHFGSYEALDGSGTSLPRVTGVYTVDDRITGSLTVADNFAQPVMGMSLVTAGVLHYAFTDGHQTLTEANSTGSFYVPRFDLGLDPANLQWNIAITTPTGGISSYRVGDRYDLAVLDANNQGINGVSNTRPDGSHAGTWIVSVPEPMSLLLVLAGIGGVMLARLRSRSRP